jgi:hypothetical protein
MFPHCHAIDKQRAMLNLFRLTFLNNQVRTNTQGANRKAMQPGDVFKALDDLEFGGFKERLEAELASMLPGLGNLVLGVLYV